MGRTKALVEVDGVPMAARVDRALRDAGCATVVAIGGAAEELAPLGLAVVADVEPGAGPLGGIVAALEAFALTESTGWVCVAACDLPGLDAATIERLAAAAAQHPEATVIVARTDRLEPACALWNLDGAPRVRASYDAGVRAVHEVLDVVTAVAVDVDAAALRNINTPDDLGRYPGRSD